MATKKPETGKRIPTKEKGVYVYVSTTDTDPRTGKPDQVWTITYKDREGKKKWEKIGWASEGYSLADAVEIRANRMKALRHGEELPVKDHKKEKEVEALEGLTVDQYWERFRLPYLEGAVPKDIANRKAHYNNWIKPSLGSRVFASLSALDIDRWMTGIQKAVKVSPKDGQSTPLADQTKKHIQLTFKGMCEMAYRHGVIPVNHFAEVKLTKVVRFSNSRTEFLSTSQMQILWQALSTNESLYRAVLVSVMAGLRRSEIIKLKNRDIRLDANEILLKDTKNGSTVHHPISVELVSALSKLDLSNLDAPFLPTIHDKSALTHAFKKLVDKLGMNEGVKDRRNRIVLHTLRHTFVSWLLKNPDISLKTAMSLSRHGTLEMLQRYTHVREQEKRNAINGIDGLFKESLTL